MNIPDKVKIGGLTYTVSLENDLLRDSDSIGQSFGNRQSIVVDSGISDQLKETTFIHEVIHQLSFVYHLELNEDETARLEAAAYAFIKDNPDVFKEEPSK